MKRRSRGPGVGYHQAAKYLFVCNRCKKNDHSHCVSSRCGCLKCLKELEKDLEVG